MSVKRITERIFQVGVVDWDRRLFDELIPLPRGTSYNSYLIKGKDKNILIDTVDLRKTDELFENLDSLNINRIDYVVCQHAEQDHSGSIPAILRRFTGAKVITNEKCRDLLVEHFRLKEEDFVLVKDDEALKIGDITLRFIFAPWVHWPETMLTYLEEDKSIFTCDMFGSHLATYHIFSDDDPGTFIESKRYFAEIMLPFRNHLRRHLDRITSCDIEYILPSHGPVHRRPFTILDYYKRWSSDRTTPIVLIPYVSMYGSTANMVKYLANHLELKGLAVIPLNLTETDVGEFATHLIDASTVIFATPTLLGGPHPVVAYAALLMNALRPPTKYIGFVGSYGWGGKTEDVLRGFIANIKYNYIGSVFTKGCPKESTLKDLKNMAERIFLANQS